MASSGTTVNAGSDTVRTLPVDRVQDLLKLQKAAHKINSILDLDQLIDKIARQNRQRYCPLFWLRRTQRFST